MNFCYNAETGYANIPPLNHLSTWGRKMTYRNISQKRIKEVLSYNSHTGIFTWKHREICEFKTRQSFAVWNAKYSEKVAGHIALNGYVQICIDNVNYRGHRIAWCYAYGVFPENDIDHINGDVGDNRINNLRDVRHIENQRNAKQHKNNTSGVTGVSWNKGNKKWHARIGNKKTSHIGYFDDFENAVKAREKAEIEFGYHVNHGRKM